MVFGPQEGMGTHPIKLAWELMSDPDERGKGAMALIVGKAEVRRPKALRNGTAEIIAKEIDRKPREVKRLLNWLMRMCNESRRTSHRTVTAGWFRSHTPAFKLLDLFYPREAGAKKHPMAEKLEQYLLEPGERLQVHGLPGDPCRYREITVICVDEASE